MECYNKNRIANVGIGLLSSVAREAGGGGAIAPTIGLPTKMQNKENITFLAILRLSFALDWTKK